MPYEKRTCKDCSAVYTPYQYNQIRCGECVSKLGGKYKGTPPEKECPTCGNLFRRSTPRQKYCSKRCGGTQRHCYIEATYGLTPKQYNAMLEACGNKCTICRKRGKLVVDHCHDTGKVRGLLCRECNLALGHFKDSISSLLNAVEYLQGSETIPKGSTSEANADGSA